MAGEYLVTFGEIMGRFMPPNHLRLGQVMPGSLELTFGGAEANVAVSASRLGTRSRFVTALPDNPLSRACMDDLRRHGVDVAGIVLSGEGRFGLYFVERGANLRPSRVIYDRAGSTISVTPPSAYPWDELLADAAWLHVTGITPAISKVAAEATAAAMTAARSAGLTVSMDLNYRRQLWRWEPGTDSRALARRVVRDLLPNVDLLIGNEEDAEDVLGIRAGASDVEAGKLDIGRYPDVAGQISAQFGNIRKIAFTLRESISADHNNWGAMLYDAAAGSASFAPTSDGEYAPYQIRDIVDRVGGGDAFVAGLIRAMTGGDVGGDDEALAFAVAASCLAHSIPGDYNVTSFEEAMALARGSGSGRVVR